MPNSREIVRFANVPEHGELSVALATSAEANVAVLANLSLHEPPSLRRSAPSNKRSQLVPQDATSDCVLLDF